MGNLKFYKLILLLMYASIGSNALAQNDSLSSGEYPNDPIWYFSFGVSPYSNFISAPVIKVPQNESIIVDSQAKRLTTQYQAMQLFSFSYSVRVNVFRIDEDRSLSLNTPICLGLSSIKCMDGSRGFLSLSVPLMLEYNVGTASNFSTLQWKGWMFGAGAEFNVFPLISNEKYSYISSNGLNSIYTPSHLWLQPAAEVAYRWINTDQNTREVNLKIGCGLPQKIDGSSYTPFSAKITYVFMINY